MKIKEVMERTGLTDRAIRHYIECGLLAPHSDDSCTGRKNYAFTREDVERLETIKVFREAGFGIEQIRELLSARSVRRLVQERLSQLEAEKQFSEQMIKVLQRADIGREVSLEELTIILSSCPVKAIDPEEIYASTPLLTNEQAHEEKPFTMRSSWWRKVYGETTVEIKDSVRGVITKMRQQQRETSTRYYGVYGEATGRCEERRFRCSKKGTFTVRCEMDALGLRGKVFAQNGKTYIRFFEVYEPLWTVLWIILILLLLPFVLACYLYELLTGNIQELMLDIVWDYRVIRSVRGRKEALSVLREDMIRQIEAIRRWDE